MKIPDNEKNKFRHCIKCMWNNFKGISKTVVHCSMMSCDINKQVDKFKRYKNG